MNDIPGFYYWQTYWGELHRDNDAEFPSIVYGFENLSATNRDKTLVSLPDMQHAGACYGFVQQGSVEIIHQQRYQISALQWFSCASGCELLLAGNSALVIAQRVNYLGMNAMGGPIETMGRLRYIDGCSDTLLCAPPLQGDPCLNLLHFPPGIDQTDHTHPSARAGMVARGNGVCVLGERIVPLTAGIIFYIAKDCVHKFRTGQDTLDVIAYHPDSDWGPTHEAHPMINRTWVDGVKIDNASGRHLQGEWIDGKSSELESG